MTPIDRRRFLALSAAGLAGCSTPAAAPELRGRLLLRSSWQTVNIGDIAHTPGMLAWLERRLPGVEVVLWPSPLSGEVEALLRARFPRLQIASSGAAQREALASCDAALHGSGPGLVGGAALRQAKQAGKPYGFGGVTLSDAEVTSQRDLLEGASFVYTRDSLSLAALQGAGLEGEFGPDATFGLDLRDDARAVATLASLGLAPGSFACFVPRLRWTPYWKEGRRYEPGEIERREAENERHREADHSKLREAIVRWVRDLGRPALLCPEMTHAVPLLRPLLFDPLPEDVKRRVSVLPRYWITAEAASVYARAAAVVSLEMHSPIIAVANGTPAIHVRQPTDTRKGVMWRDVGLGDWLFEVEEATGAAIAERLLEIGRDPAPARRKAEGARAFAAGRGDRMMDSVAAMLRSR